MSTSTKCAKHRYRNGLCTKCGRKQPPSRQRKPRPLRRRSGQELNRRVIKRIAKQVARGVSVSAAVADAGFASSTASRWKYRAMGAEDTSDFTDEHIALCKEYLDAIERAQVKYEKSLETVTYRGAIGDLKRPAKRTVTKEDTPKGPSEKTVEEYHGANPELALKILERRFSDRWGRNQQITVSQQGKIDHMHHLQSLPQNDLKALENVLESECEQV